jgi:hypothetical protein
MAARIIAATTRWLTAPPAEGWWPVYLAALLVVIAVWTMPFVLALALVADGGAR